MPQIQLSDLFHRKGHDFDWQVRIEDQKNLITRLREHDKLATLADALESFAGEGIASAFYLDLLLKEITTKCSRHRIDII